MAIVAFWNDDKEQTGKTLSAVATATRMAIERNFKVLLISTNYRDFTLKKCFFEDMPTKKGGLFGGKSAGGIGAENGMEGLARLINSSKIAPASITNYTRVIFKNRLEILTGYQGTEGEAEATRFQDYRKSSRAYPELIKLANNYYDMVIVDVDNMLDKEVKDAIIDSAEINAWVITQKMSYINKRFELKAGNPERFGPQCMTVIGKYDRDSKYSKKNIMRSFKDKREVSAVPYNILFAEAAEEANVVEMFLKMRNIKDTLDNNYFFMNETLELVNNIIMRIQEVQMRMR